MQAAVDLWDVVSTRYLALTDAPLPRSVFHDSACAFDVGGGAQRDGEPASTALHWRGRRVVVRSRPHGGRLLLPSGTEVEATARAAASTYAEDGSVRPFFNMSLMPLWRASLPPSETAGAVSAEFLTIAQHEMTHALYLRFLREKAAKILGDAPGTVVHVDDDAVQTAFAGDVEFAGLLKREIELLDRAFRATGRGDKERLVRESLESMRSRRAMFFTGERAPLAELEPLFLFLEGVGEWTRYRLVRGAAVLPDHSRLAAVDPGFDNYASWRSLDEAGGVAYVRGNRRFWVQDHGLALFVVLDQLWPEWPRSLPPGEAVSPYALLDEAMSDRRKAR